MKLYIETIHIKGDFHYNGDEKPIIGIVEDLEELQQICHIYGYMVKVADKFVEIDVKKEVK